MFQNWFKKNKFLILTTGILFLLLALEWVLYACFGHRLIEFMYKNKMTGFLNKITGDKAIHPLEYYFMRIDLLMLGFTRAISILLFLFLLFKEIISSIPKDKFINNKEGNDTAVNEPGTFVFKNWLGDHAMLGIFILFILLGWIETMHMANSIAIVGALVNFGTKGILILAVFLMFVPKKHLKTILVLWSIATINLYIKMDPVIIPGSWGKFYGIFASKLEYTHICVSTRWFGPWIAHNLGFHSPQGWLAFLLASFLIGIAYLYIGLYRLTNDNKWAFITALIPIATTMGWFNVYCPGYPDWILFTLLTAALFVKNDRHSLIIIVLVLFIHERSAFVIFFLPFIRALLNKEFNAKRILNNFMITCSIILFFLILKKYIAIGENTLTTRFYLSELLNGQSVYAPTPLTLQHIFIAAFEGYKSFIFLYIICFVALFKTRFFYKRFSFLVIITFFFFVLLQLLIAIDSVRLMDLLIYPILLVLLLCYREVPRFRKYLFIFTIISLCINQLLPVIYKAQNGYFVPKSTVNSLWGKYTTIPDAFRLTPP